MALVFSLIGNRSNVLVASTANLSVALGQMSTLLSQAAAGQTALADSRAALLSHLQTLEDSGILLHQTDLLRRFADGGEDLSAEGLAEIVTRIELIKAADSPQVPPQDLQEALRRLTGPTSPSLVPSVLRPRTSVVQVKPKGMEHMVFCPTCHFPNPDRAKFCNECAMPLVEMPAIEPGERDMTMLFTDLKGFDDFSRGLPATVLFPLMNEILAGLGAVATSEGGHLVGSWGDAVFAAFGTPDRPMEDHPIRAVRTALKMQEFMRTWSERQTARGRRGLELRVGINTGTVAWGVLGLPGKRDQNGMGEEINTAARLEPIAFRRADDGTVHGAIAVSEATLERLAGRFETVSMGEATVKTRKVRYHLVTRERPQALALAPKGAEQVRFIGRTVEMEALQENFRAAVGEEKKGRLVVVSGEAGSGKTRLGTEFIGEIGRAGVAVSLVTARGEDLPAVPPYRAIVRAIEHMAGMEGNESEDERRQRLLSLIQRTISAPESDPELTTQLLGNLLGIGFKTPHPVMQALQKNAEDLRERTLDAVVTLFDHMAQRQTVVLIAEDLHWMDRGSLRYLQVLLERLKNRPFFVLGLTRPEFFEGEAQPLLQGGYHVHRVDLGTISQEELGLMVDEVFGSPPEPEVRGFLVTESRGNTYLLQEMARAVRGGWQVVTEGSQRYLASPDDRKVPSGIVGFLQARIDHLTEEQRLLLRAASVIGAEFSVEGLEALGLEGTATTLADLTRQNLLIPVSEGRYQFPHALLRDTAYDQIPQANRQALHRGVAWHLIQSKSVEPALIASHLEEGNERDQAATFYFRAAEEATKIGAYRTAASFHEKTHDLSQDLTRRLQALFGWEEVLYKDRRYGDALPLLEKFDALVPGMPSGERENLAAVRFHKARILTSVRRAEEAEQEILQGLQSYQKGETAATKCLLLNLLGGIHSRIRNDFQRARGSYLHQLETARKLGDPSHIGLALLDVGRMEDALGRQSEALAADQEALRLCKTGGDLREALRAYNNASTVLILIGRAEEALPQLREAVEISRRYLGGDRLDLLLLTSAQAAIFLGRYDEAVAFLEEALPTHEGRNPDQITNETHLHLALAHSGRKDWPKALAAAQEALRIADSIKDESEGAKDRSLMARAFLGMGRKEEALAESSRAIEVREKIGTIEQFDEEVLLTHVQVLMAFGRHEEAFASADKAKRQIEGSAAKISDDEHRRSFLTQVPYNREVLRLWQILQVMRDPTKSDLVKRRVAERNFQVPPTLPEDVQFAASGEAGHVIGDIERHGKVLAGAVVDRPPADVFATLLSQPVLVAKNPWEIPVIWAQNIRVEPIQDEAGRLFYLLRWDYGSVADQEGSSVETRGFVSTIISLLAREELLEEHRITDSGGGTVIELRRASQTLVKSGLTGAVVEVNPNLRPHENEFGAIRFILVPTIDHKTVVVLEMEKARYSQGARNILEAIVR